MSRLRLKNVALSLYSLKLPVTNLYKGVCHGAARKKKKTIFLFGRGNYRPDQGLERQGRAAPAGQFGAGLRRRDSQIERDEWGSRLTIIPPPLRGRLGGGFIGAPLSCCTTPSPTLPPSTGSGQAGKGEEEVVSFQARGIYKTHPSPLPSLLRQAQDKLQGRGS